MTQIMSHLPQLYETYTRRTSEGVSLLAQHLNLMGGLSGVFMYSIIPPKSFYTYLVYFTSLIQAISLYALAVYFDGWDRLINSVPLLNRFIRTNNHHNNNSNSGNNNNGSGAVSGGGGSSATMTAGAHHTLPLLPLIDRSASVPSLASSSSSSSSTGNLSHKMTKAPRADSPAREISALVELEEQKSLVRTHDWVGS